MYNNGYFCMMPIEQVLYTVYCKSHKGYLPFEERMVSANV